LIERAQNQTVLIIGKGPSAKPPHELPATFRFSKIAALNGAAKLCPWWVDYLFVNDLERFEELPSEVLTRAKLLVVPTELHRNWGKETLPTAAHLPNPCPPVSFYRLHTATMKTAAPDFGKIASVGDTAVAWLLHRGYRKFLLSGVGSQPGYSEDFHRNENEPALPDSWFVQNWERIKTRLEEAGAEWEVLS